MAGLESVAWLIPSALEPSAFGWLVLISAGTSMITAVTGVGGGATLLVFMINMMPPMAVIPVHGVVQLGSNGGRVAVMWRHIRWTIVGGFTLGCIVGSAVGGQVVLNIPADWLKIIVGVFIFLSCWTKLTLSFLKRGSNIVLGAVTSFLAMFVGVTGSFVIAALRPTLANKFELLGTMAAVMGVQHLTKAVVFGLFGFAFVDWAGLIVLMILSGFIGTLCGRLILGKIPDGIFDVMLKWVITLMALNIIYSGVSSLWLANVG